MRSASCCEVFPPPLAVSIRAALVIRGEIKSCSLLESLHRNVCVSFKKSPKCPPGLDVFATGRAMRRGIEASPAEKMTRMQTYIVDIAGEPVTLPLVPSNDKLAISLLMVIDRGVRFGERIGNALAQKLGPLKPDIVVGAATLGIPVVIEVSRALGLDQYVIAQKSPKIHLADALVEELQSVTSSGKQRLMLDRRAVTLLAKRRVVVVDDVVATGSSLAATFALARAAGAEIVGAGVILTEGHDWKKTLGADARLVRGLGHIPQFALADGKATPMPETLKIDSARA